MAEAAINETTVISLLLVLALLTVSWLGSLRALPRSATAGDRALFIWLAFDALTHFMLEGSFIFYSVLGRTVHTSNAFLATMWAEYANADRRWGVADPTVVSLELLTVFIAGPLAVLSLLQLVRGDSARHYWLVVLSTMEIYGGWMTFCPEWLTGSANLDTENWLYLYVFLWLLNGLWVIIPFWIMYDSYFSIVNSLRTSNRPEKERKAA